MFLIAKKRKVTTDNLIILRIYGKKIENKINDVSIRKIIQIYIMKKYEGGNSEKILLLCNKNYESPQ